MAGAIGVPSPGRHRVQNGRIRPIATVDLGAVTGKGWLDAAPDVWLATGVSEN